MISSLIAKMVIEIARAYAHLVGDVIGGRIGLAVFVKHIQADL